MPLPARPSTRPGKTPSAAGLTWRRSRCANVSRKTPADHYRLRRSTICNAASGFIPGEASMVRRLSSVAVLFLLVAAGASGAPDPTKYTAKPGTTEVPKELAEPVRALLSDKTVQLQDKEGKVY